jgi:hypothetical protein
LYCATVIITEHAPNTGRLTADGLLCSFVASASSAYAPPTYDAWAVFDSGLSSTFWHGNLPAYNADSGITLTGAAVPTTTVQSLGTVSGEWIQITLPKAYTVTWYKVTPRLDLASFQKSRSASKWRVVGTNAVTIDSSSIW